MGEYKDRPKYQERVIDELDQLSSKCSRLMRFLETESFMKLSIDEQWRLRKQYIFMCLYYDVLEERIENFEIS